jgi:chromosome segregation ATPase
MDLKSFHEKLDNIFNLDKATGELGKGLSELKDDHTTLHKEYVELQSQLKTITEERNLALEQKEKLVIANGELLMRTPVKQEYTPNNPYVQKDEDQEGSQIEKLLGGIKI